MEGELLYVGPGVVVYPRIVKMGERGKDNTRDVFSKAALAEYVALVEEAHKRSFLQELAGILGVD